jgi:uncharacterized protein YqgV (UPF0045/DUF77 family)
MEQITDTKITDAIIKEKVVVNYDKKTQYMVDNNLKQSDINEFINFMNYCFLVRNNFFIENFNTKIIKYVCQAYNKIKTNILDNECTDLFANIEQADLKTIRFIVKNIANNYDRFIEYNSKMAEHVSKDGMKRFKNFIDIKLKIL